MNTTDKINKKLKDLNATGNTLQPEILTLKECILILIKEIEEIQRSLQAVETRAYSE